MKVLQSRECRLDSQISGQRAELVVRLVGVGEAVAATLGHGSKPLG